MFVETAFPPASILFARATLAGRRVRLVLPAAAYGRREDCLSNSKAD
jgi:hypothetical protein